MTRWGRVAIFAVVAAVAGCGSAPGAVFDATRSQAALRRAGWMATSGAGMADTYSHVPQTAFLSLVAPNGDRLEVQFLASAGDAAKELSAAHSVAPAFHGRVIGNALVFASPDGTTTAKDGDIAALTPLLLR